MVRFVKYGEPGWWAYLRNHLDKGKSMVIREVEDVPEFVLSAEYLEENHGLAPAMKVDYHGERRQQGAIPEKHSDIVEKDMAMRSADWSNPYIKGELLDFFKMMDDHTVIHFVLSCQQQQAAWKEPFQ